MHACTYTQQRTEGILSDLNPSCKQTVPERCVLACLVFQPALQLLLCTFTVTWQAITWWHTCTPAGPHKHTHLHMQICKRHLQHVSMISFTLKTHLQHTCMNYEYFLIFFHCNLQTRNQIKDLVLFQQLNWNIKTCLLCTAFNDKTKSKLRIMFRNLLDFFFFAICHVWFSPEKFAYKSFFEDQAVCVGVYAVPSGRFSKCV